MTRYPLFGLLTAILGALLLSPDTLLMRWAEMDGFHMLAWRGLLAGSIFITLWFITRQGRRAEDIANLKRPFGLGLITCQFFNATLFSLGVSIAPVALVLLGVATVPIFAALFAYIILREPTETKTWIAIGAVLCGLSVAVFTPENGHVQINIWSLVGALAGLGVAVTLSMSFVLIRHQKNRAFFIGNRNRRAFVWIIWPVDDGIGQHDRWEHRLHHFHRYDYSANLIFPVIFCRTLHARLQCQPRAAVRNGSWAGLGLDRNPRAANTDDVIWWIYCDFKPFDLPDRYETSKVI